MRILPEKRPHPLLSSSWMPSIPLMASLVARRVPPTAGRRVPGHPWACVRTDLRWFHANLAMVAVFRSEDIGSVGVEFRRAVSVSMAAPMNRRLNSCHMASWASLLPWAGVTPRVRAFRRENLEWPGFGGAASKQEPVQLLMTAGSSGYTGPRYTNLKVYSRRYTNPRYTVQGILK